MFVPTEDESAKGQLEFQKNSDDIFFSVTA